MNLNINSNYQSPNFNAKMVKLDRILQIPAAVGTAAAIHSTTNQDEGKSPEELSGIVQTMSKPTIKTDENVYQFCERILSELACIEKGEYDDYSPNDIDNIKKRIDMIRNLRTEIKNNAEYYKDSKGKDLLKRLLGSIIEELNDMKRILKQIDCKEVGYGEVNDNEVNNEIYEMLK